MSRPVRRRLAVLLAVIGSCHMDPVGSGEGCNFGPVDCGPGDYRGDAGETGPPDEMSCWELCEGRGPGWVGRMEWTGSELACECREVGPVPCEEDDCTARCGSLGYEHWLCDFVGCRCFHVPARDADADTRDADADDD